MRRRLIMTAAEAIASKPISRNLIGAWCLRCDAPSDSEEIVDEKRGLIMNSCTVRVRCHGEEEIGVFEFDSQNWGPDELKRGMQRRQWFHPAERLGNILNGGRIG